MSCKAETSKHKQCTRSAKQSGYCLQHYRMQQPTEIKKLVDINKSYKKELAVLHERIRTYTQLSRKFGESLQLLEDMDRIKYSLIQLEGPNVPFKRIIRMNHYANELEEIFGIPFREIPNKYEEMLKERNFICHRYTHQLWDKY